MATNTKNYNLHKIDLTDAPPDITVLNPNFDTIDKELKSLDDELNGTTDKLNVLSDKLNTKTIQQSELDNIKEKGDYVFIGTGADGFSKGYVYNLSVTGGMLTGHGTSITQTITCSYNTEVDKTIRYRTWYQAVGVWQPWQQIATTTSTVANADTVDGIHGNQFARTDIATTFYNSVTINYPQSLNVRHVEGARNSELFLNYISGKQIYMNTPETGIINLGYEIASTRALALSSSSVYNLHSTNVLETLSGSLTTTYPNEILIGKFTPKYDGSVYINYNISSRYNSGYAQVRVMSPNDVVYSTNDVTNHNVIYDSTPVGSIVTGDHMYRKNFMNVNSVLNTNPTIMLPIAVKKGVPIYLTLRSMASSASSVTIDYVKILGSVVNG